MASAEEEKYELLEKIGCGSFGVIRKVRRKLDGYILCRKEINYIKMSQKEREQLTTEFNILSSLRHPNIVQYFHREHLKETQDLYLYMEYCGGGDLSMVIKNLKATNKLAEEQFVWRILSQLVTALYRCHYGVDPPGVGPNVFGPPTETKPSGLRTKQGQVTILHRDLKPENIFLGADQSVKLGDFGLSKLLGSHDFASTYVGTPFYMSPEICAAEKYTLKSDIWAVGCIMYELCQKDPPFNARTHVQLVQRIREGKYAQLPGAYSSELKSVIGSCLRVNPDHRPDTAALLNVPVIRLVRKEREVVELDSAVRSREESALQKVRETERNLARIEKERASMRTELENMVRREWEVKARLEIDRHVQMELEKLRKRFEVEVQERVTAELQRHNTNNNDKIYNSKTIPTPREALDSQSSLPEEAETSQSSLTSGDDSDIPSSTDLSSLSLESPKSDATKPTKGHRTPFCRSKTTFDSPLDVQMVDPSPMSIASLSLSPRRRVAEAAGCARNIFAEGPRRNPRLDATIVYSDEEDDIPELPSPTRQKVKSDPFKVPARPLLRQNTTAMMQKLNTHHPSIFAVPSPSSSAKSVASTKVTPRNAVAVNHKATLSSAASHADLRSAAAAAADSKITRSSTSPSRRRLTKIPSCTNLASSTENGGSPSRKVASAAKIPSSFKANAGGEDMFKAVMQRNMGGRTLVELAQARAAAQGGSGKCYTEDIVAKRNNPGESRIPTSTNSSITATTTETTPVMSATPAAEFPQAYLVIKTTGAPMAREPPATWDPERDEMPSPFLARGTKVIRNLR